MKEDLKFMSIAIKEAIKATKLSDDVPVGAVIVLDNKVIVRGHNKRQKNKLATAHAEIIAIEKACKVIADWRLNDCTMYITLEPCPMCAGAILQARIGRVVFGAYDKKGGALGSLFNLFEIKGLNHYPQIAGGIGEEECSKLLKDYFKEKRLQKRNEQKN